MPFILAPGSLEKLNQLRQDYEAQKHVDLNVKPSWIGTPTLFGGTDVVNRNKQIAFLEKVIFVLKMHLLKEEHIKTAQQRMANLIASRFIIAACLYVQSQIASSKRNSVLYRIIADNLGITTENFLDKEDKEECFLTAKRLVDTPNALDHSNTALEKAGLKGFSEKEWNKFSQFLHEMCRKIESKNQYNSFPITSITKPLFGTAFTYVGASLGFVAAEAISHSTSAISPSIQLTALVGSTLLILNPSGSTGVAILAPMIASKLLTSFCSISLTHAMGTTMGLLGQGVGIGVGLPFDVAYNVLWNVCSIISRYYSPSSQLALINGTRISDGAMIIAGIPIQALTSQDIPEGYARKILEITENGEIRIQGEEDLSKSPMQLPDEVLQELKKRAALDPEQCDTETEEGFSAVV